MAVRTRVFVGEQKVSGEEEFDGLDPESTHVVALDETGVVATCRLRWLEGDVCKLERMAVTERYRGQGVGARLSRDPSGSRASAAPPRSC